MTAEQLATLGYQPSMGSPDLTQATSATSDISPADLQQFYAMAGNPNAGTPDPASLNPRPAFIDPALLNALGPQPSGQSASDPNGLISAPDQSAMGNPGSPGQSAQQSAPSVASNPATNPYVPGGAADQVSGSQSSAAQPQQPQLSEFDKFMIQSGRAGIDLTPPERLAAHKAFDAYQLKFLDAQLKKQDPEFQLKVQQMQHDISTEGLKDQNLQATTAESNSKVVATELAKQQAQQTVADQLAQLQTQKQNLDAVINHPALNSMVGAAQQYNPGFTDQERDLKARLQQLQGQGLINGINLIKSEAANPNGTLGMRITQQEALAVQNAAQRLQRFQSPETFRASAQELSDFLGRSIDAKQKQLASLPAPNMDLMQKNNYTPSSASSSPAGASTSSVAPQIKTIAGMTFRQNPQTGGWVRVQ
jgi:hypothetical protein